MNTANNQIKPISYNERIDFPDVLQGINHAYCQKDLFASSAI